MSDKKVISVIGATGAQGGGLVRAILHDKSGGFSVRALTRNVNSDKAKALADMGAEVVAADYKGLESIGCGIGIGFLNTGRAPVGATKGTDLARFAVRIQHIDNRSHWLRFIVAMQNIEIDIIDLEAGE